MAVIKVLFVCLCNVCRSPMAESVFKNILRQRGIQDQFEVDSAGLIDWQVGNLPEERSLTILKKYNVSFDGHISRLITNTDLMESDYIFGMDLSNISQLRRILPKESKAKIYLLGDFNPNGDRIIQDPFFDDGIEGYEKCYQQCVLSCNAFLDQFNQNIDEFK